MFNAFVAYQNTFTVEFIKADGSPGKVTGKLIAPNYEGTQAEFMKYLVSLEDKDIIPVYTDKGWRSFYKDNVMHFYVG